MDPVVPAVAAWLLKNAVVPDGYQRVVDALRQSPWHRAVLRDVRRAVDARPSRRYRRWLRRPETFELLNRRTEDAYAELVTTLSAAEAKRWFRSQQVDDARVEQLVIETIRSFLPALDPSLAIAVSDDRSEDRHSELLDRMDAKSSFEQLTEQLPPPARDVLRTAQAKDPAAERVAHALAAGDPRNVLSAWALRSPDWLGQASGAVFAALGVACQAYGLRSQASEFLEEAATRGHEVQRSYATAAFEAAASENAERATHLLDRAQQLGRAGFVERVGAAIANDHTAVLAVGDPDIGSSLDVNLVAYALRTAERLEESIALLKRARDADSERTSSALLLGSALLERSGTPATTSRTMDRREALQLAVGARDQRRRWGGDSVEAVELACQAALLLGEYERVVKLGTRPPRGEALEAEATDPEVMFSVAQAAMALGDAETLGQVARSSEGFKQALLDADIAAQHGAPIEELQQRYEAAWRLAANDLDKFAVWMGAAHAGIEPVPGENELAGKGELYVLCRAARHLARGELAQAADLLRPLHSNESARRLLVSVYVAGGSVDDAVRELRDMASRFSTSEPLVRAVELLVDDGQTQEAADLADQALRVTQPGTRPRRFLHEVGVAAAHDRRAWSEMETRLRAWIEESGATRRTSYLLAQARFNQTDLDGAWRVIQELEGDATPGSPLEAQLWIVLASKFEPGAATLSRALALVETYADDPGVRAAGVNAFLLAEDTDDVSADDLSRWQEHVRARADADDPDDTFISITLPDDAEGMIEALRPFLEPQAERITEWREKVRREGFPVGMLAVAAGRPYTAALVHRAAGCVPFASINAEVRRAEREAANAALELGRILVDNSAISTGWLLSSIWETLIASFGAVYTTDESRRDAAAASDAPGDRGSGTLGWDLMSGRPSLHEDDSEVFDRLHRHASWIWEQTLRFPTESLPPASTERDPEALGAWMMSFEVARALGLPLWADDVGLRTLARNEGVAAFGTDSLLAALVDAGRFTIADADGAFAGLREEFYVDLPLDEDWLFQAANDGGSALGP
ncbi:MAG: hypothetical protein LC808_02130, partial [Actinobacteria bacterium]|nr:hypothetical protein [Actinomycetota bacterium]